MRCTCTPMDWSMRSTATGTETPSPSAERPACPVELHFEIAIVDNFDGRQCFASVGIVSERVFRNVRRLILLTGE